jgi:hypothetical protein
MITLSIDAAALRKQFAALGVKTEIQAVAAANRMAGFAAARAAVHTPLADVGQIRQLEARPWWPKFVAKILARKRPLRPAPGRKYSRHYSQAEARAFSAQLLADKTKRSGVLRAGWRPAVQELTTSSLELSQATAGTGHVHRPHGSAEPARMGHDPKLATFSNLATGRGAEIAQTALEKGIKEMEAKAPELIERELKRIES